MAKAYADYTIGDMKRLELSWLVKNKTEEVAKVQTEAFKYILMTGLNLNINLDNFKLLEHFGADSNSILHDKGEINKVIFSLSKTSEVVNAKNYGIEKIQAQKAVIVKATAMDYASSIRDRESARDSYLTDARSYQELVTNNLVDATKAADKIKEYKRLQASGMVDDTVYKTVLSIIENPFWQCVAIEGTTMYFATTEPVTQSQINPAAGLDLQVSFGILVAVLDVNRNTLKVVDGPYSIKAQSGGYYHTHIGSAGSICWGSSSSRVDNLLIDRDYPKVFELLQMLLTTYESSNPYISLGDYHEIVNGDLAWQRKYKEFNATPYMTKTNYAVMPEFPDRTHNCPYDITTKIRAGMFLKLMTSRSTTNFRIAKEIRSDGSVRHYRPHQGNSTSTREDLKILSQEEFQTSIRDVGNGHTVCTESEASDSVAGIMVGDFMVDTHSNVYVIARLGGRILPSSGQYWSITVIQLYNESSNRNESYETTKNLTSLAPVSRDYETEDQYTARCVKYNTASGVGSDVWADLLTKAKAVDLTDYTTCKELPEGSTEGSTTAYVSVDRIRRFECDACGHVHQDPRVDPDGDICCHECEHYFAAEANEIDSIRRPRAPLTDSTSTTIDW